MRGKVTSDARKKHIYIYSLTLYRNSLYTAVYKHARPSIIFPVINYFGGVLCAQLRLC